MNAVDVVGAGKVFNPGTTKQVDAVVDVDLSVAAGEFVSLIGPSGCGKSTLLRLIANLIEPTSGDIRVNGKPASEARLDQEYGMAFQQAGLFEWRSVVKNVELPLELKGWDRGQRRQRAMEMLQLVKLGDFAEHRPWQLSGGMQQRVAIARALAAHPPLLLMDEPFGALDEMTREHMQAELLRICAETGTSVVFVTHSIPEAVYLSDRVVVMSPRPGRIIHVVDVELGDRRDVDTREDASFFKKITEVREALRGHEVDDIEAAVGLDDQVNARRVFRAAWPPAVFGVLFLVAWEGAVELFDWQPYFLPKPSRIWDAFTGNLDQIWEAAKVSGTNALIGLLFGTAFGVAMAFLLMRFRLLNDMFTPLAISLNAIPIFVLVAVFNNMFAITSEIPRRLMVTLVVYFIVLVNVAKGLRQVEATHLELLRSYAAKPSQVLTKARIPNAVPYLFQALTIAAPAAVITAFVAEYFGGSQNGLGNRIASNMTANTAAAWAYVLGACLLGLVFYLISIALESITTHQRGTSPGGGPTT